MAEKQLEKEVAKLDVSIFEIVGPIMIGPSSSHTAGMARIGRMAKDIIGADLKRIQIALHPQIKSTFKGHETDVAIVGGLLGMREDDESIKDALKIAEKKNIDTMVSFLPSTYQNPNTVVLTVESDHGIISITGISIGGGSFKITDIDGKKVSFTGKTNYLFVNYTKKETENKIIKTLEADKALQEKQLGYGAIQTRNNYLFWLSFLNSMPGNILREIRKLDGVIDARISPPILSFGLSKQPHRPLFKSIRELMELAREQGSLFEAVLKYETNRSGRTAKEIIDLMGTNLEIMQKAVDQGLKEEITLVTGLASGIDGKLLARSVENGNSISGDVLPTAISRALAVMEVNGSMGTVVAAPTAGSCGIIPGCLLTVKDKKNLSDFDVIRALIVAGGIGVTFAHAGVSFSGAVGGCQSEVGVSSALAASALVELVGGNPMQVAHAAALAIKNMLGLVCDPLGGPVEVPCIKRNAIGVANAFAAAEMALAGIKSVIPPDEVLLALKNVQSLLPSELKGSAMGGLACTPTARKFRGESDLCCVLDS